MRKRLLILPVLLIGGLSYAGHSWWQSPATVSASNDSATNVSTVLGSETSLSSWQTAFFTTLKPNSLQVKRSAENPAGPIPGSYLLTSTTGREGDQVGVTIGNLGNNTLADIPAIKLRQTQATTYTPTIRSFAPSGSISFNRDDGEYESSVFWQHGNQYAAVVASGSSERRADLDQALTNIVSNWQWQ